MTWYEFFLFVHITAAVIWLGGAFTFQMYGMVVRRGGDPEEIARFAGRAGSLSERVFVPASLLVILAGIALMINGNWDWDQLWVIFALVTFAASFLTGVLVLSPMAKRIPVAGPTTSVGQALIERLFTILRVDLSFSTRSSSRWSSSRGGRRLDDRNRSDHPRAVDGRVPCPTALEG
ncbi:MAG TPA: DUF2269 family protein [Gaiellaceae bacterium]|nr:DUF2269 family protein [Gaiellaceae bacterium]